ncbi:MAG: LPS export ABC transporter periplasmic protein LptC [Desulfovibrio sp.]|nr:MAG: LPS export ABC transporter periplasmic protein LptC [Desulfovibrio sp.]
MARLFWGMLLILAGGAALWYFLGAGTGRPDLAEVEVDTEQDQAVDLSAQGVELLHGDQGSLKWRLTAQNARFLETGGVVDVDGPEIVYFMEDMEDELRVTAQKGLIEQDDQRARLWPDVVAVYQDNVIQGGELVYDGQGETLTLTGNVTFQGQELSCSADALVFDITDNVLTMGPNVHTTFVVDMSEPELQGVDIQ